MEFNDKDYKRRKVVPTRLNFEEKYPLTSGDEISDSIKFLKDFDFKKKKCEKPSNK
ncbi:MAG: hypothetical protein ACFFD2_27085 [Promethearchaeota archaeon]